MGGCRVFSCVRFVSEFYVIRVKFFIWFSGLVKGEELSGVDLEVLVWFGSFSVEGRFGGGIKVRYLFFWGFCFLGDRCW